MNSAGQSAPMDFNRIISGVIRAARLDQAFFKEVEGDTGYTQDAWVVVIAAGAAAAIAGFLGSLIFGGGFFHAIGQLIWQVIATIGGFALWAWLVQWIGTRFFKGQGDFGEVQRTLGFAYGPRILSIVGFIPCVGSLIAFAGAIWSLVAGYFAIREALDQDNTNAILTIVVAWVAVFIVTVAIGSVLGLGAFLGSSLTGR